jgi:hypothetical protein
MKKMSLIVMALMLLSTAATVGAEDWATVLVADPPRWDFGEVLIGTTSTVIITVTNISGWPVHIMDVNIPQTDGEFFFIAITPPVTHSPPYTFIAPGDTLTIEVGYRASSAIWQDDLIIDFEVSDIQYPSVIVPLKGKAVAAKPTPEQQIADILAFFDAAVEAGNLMGSGPGASAPNRLKALRNMIVAAGDLIKQGKMAEACQQLLDVYNRTDGFVPPPDFVKGIAAPTLAEMIKGLRADLNCP